MDVLIVLAYLLVALLAWLGVAKVIPPGLGRAVVRSLIAAQFLSISLMVGHGAGPAPILPLLLSCPLGVCAEMYGKGGWITWLLIPLVTQTALAVAIGIGIHFARLRWGRRRKA
jgi:hypothetical protein